MNLTINNGWRGAIPGIAAMAARGDDTATLVMKIADAVAPMPGTVFTADDTLWRIDAPVPALLSYICTKEAANG